MTYNNPCPHCGSLLRGYSERRDAVYCKSCGAWLEKICRDECCRYLQTSERPEHRNGGAPEVPVAPTSQK